MIDLKTENNFMKEGGGWGERETERRARESVCRREKTWVFRRISSFFLMGLHFTQRSIFCDSTGLLTTNTELWEQSVHQTPMNTWELVAAQPGV